MIGFPHQKMNLLLGMFTRGNILDHTDAIVDRPVALVHAADSLPAPDDPAVLAQVALIHAIAIDLPLVHELDLGNFGREIVRVGNVLECLLDEFIDWVAENAAQGFVNPEPPAVESDVCDTYRSILERGPEPGLALGESVPSLDLLGNQLAE